jgi:glycosyltransferase involved in cell wall biosynthesis
MKLSVICTTYNRKAYLPDLLKSFEALVPAPFEVELELVVYDDGSTDGTERLFEDLGDQRVRYIRNAVNRGPSAGRNAAVAACRGDYLFVIDSDDVFLQRTVANFAREAKSSPGTDIFIADFLRVDAELKYVTGSDYYGWDYPDAAAVLKAIFEGKHFVQHSFLIKREVFAKAGGYDEQRKMAEDLDLYIRVLLKGGAFKYVPFISHLHRVHEGNLSARVDLAKHMEDVKALRAVYQDELASFRG